MNSELHKIKKTNRSSWQATEQTTTENVAVVSDISELICQSKYLEKFKYLAETGYEMSSDINRRHYDAYVNADVQKCIEICEETTSQNSMRWKNYRKERITASIAYTLYTFANNKNRKSEWDEKLKSVYESSFRGNEHTQYGSLEEKNAKKMYEEKNKTKIYDCGLIVSQHLPYFGASPDGIVIVNGKLQLLEIKCFAKGKVMSAKDLCLTDLNTKIFDKAQCEKGFLVLRKKHKFYGQIQLGLAVTGLQICELVVYCPYDKSFVSTYVKRDDMFIEKFIEVLSQIFFTYVLQFNSNKIDV